MELSKVDAAALRDRLENKGFDSCTLEQEEGVDDEFWVSLGCSQCDARALQGLATHETGCPNQKRNMED